MQCGNWNVLYWIIVNEFDQITDSKLPAVILFYNYIAGVDVTYREANNLTTGLKS